MNIYVIISIFTLFFIYILLSWVIKKLTIIRMRIFLKNNNVTCLTFDDGPDPIATPQILDLLSTYNIKATFFLQGKKAEKYPTIVKSMLDNGHEIGDHSYAHLHPWKFSPLQYWKDLINGKRIIEKYNISGKQVLFRPPYGKLNILTIFYSIIYNRKFAFWSLDPKDYEQSDSDSIAKYVTSKLNNGSIILLHDGRYEGEPKISDPQITVDALQLILEKSQEMDLTFVTVSEVLDK